MGNPIGTQKVRLFRPDGTSLEATPEQAEKLKLLNYAEETPEERAASNAAAGEREFYTSGGQQALTAGQGILRGATLGLTDLGADETDYKRTQYNPGLAMGSEALGAIGPLLIPGVGEMGIGRLGAEAGALAKVAARTPTALLSRGAATLTAGIESGAARAITRGALEGGAYGGIAAVDHAILSGDPVTSEAVLHGIGWGAIFGGGLSAAGVGMQKLGQSAQTAVAARAARAEAATVREAVTAAGSKAFEGMHAEVIGLRNTLREAAMTADAAMSGSAKKIMQLGTEAGIPAKELGFGVQAMKKAEKAFNKAVKEGNAAKIEISQKAYESTVDQITSRLGITAPQIGGAALKELRQLKLVQRELDRFPKTFNEFAGMGEPRAEAMFATLGSAKKLSQFPVLGQAIDEAAGRMSESLGLKASGLDGLRDTWKAAREAAKAEAKAAREATKPRQEGRKETLIEKATSFMVGGFAGKTVRNLTGSTPAGFAAYGLVKHGLDAAFGGASLSAIRNATLDRLEKAAASFAPKAGKALSVAGPRVEPLATKLDGTPDTETKPQHLASARLREIMDAAPGVKDRLYRAVEPISITQPDLAVGLHKAAIGSFQALKAMMPADPGVVSGLKSIWAPSPLQRAVMSKQYEVFQNPASVAERMLTTGQFDPIQVKAMKEIAPAVFGHLRVALLERVTMPGFLEGVSYRDQIGIGTMLDIPIHSSMRPGYIAASQQIFLDRNKPLATPALPGAAGAGGRPAANNQLATQSQRIESR